MVGVAGMKILQTPLGFTLDWRREHATKMQSPFKELHESEVNF
jgi:hypothetical protein